MQNHEHYFLTEVDILYSDKIYSSAKVLKTQLMLCFDANVYNIKIYTQAEHNAKFNTKYDVNKSLLTLYLFYHKNSIDTFNGSVFNSLSDIFSNLRHKLNNFRHKYPDLELCHVNTKIIKLHNDEYKIIVEYKIKMDMDDCSKYLASSTLNNHVQLKDIYDSNNKMLIKLPYADQVMGKGFKGILLHPRMFLIAFWQVHKHCKVVTSYSDDTSLTNIEVFNIFIIPHIEYINIQKQEQEHERQEEELKKQEEERQRLEQQELKRQAEEERQKEIARIDNTVLQCIICKDNKITTVFNCGHTCCDKCSNNINTCHNCRSDISARHPIYIS